MNDTSTRRHGFLLVALAAVSLVVAAPARAQPQLGAALARA